MNYIEKQIVRLAANIKNKDNEKSQAIQKTRDDKLNAFKQIKNDLWEQLKPIKETMLNNPCHFNVGDTVILNKYELQYQSTYCWDLGSRQLLQMVNEDEARKPIKVKITKIDVHEMYAEERIENFLDKFWESDKHELRLDNVVKNPYIAMNMFKDYIKNLNHNWINEYGLYKEAYFEPINVKFKPRWALNINSFLSLESEAGQLTERLWNEEGDLHWNWTVAKDNYEKFKVKRDGEIFAYNLIYK